MEGCASCFLQLHSPPALLTVPGACVFPSGPKTEQMDPCRASVSGVHEGESEAEGHDGASVCWGCDSGEGAIPTCLLKL